MPLIFVNYRTNDEEAAATLVERELSRVFGSGNVFRASKSIRLGSRFPQELLTAVRRSSVLLAVMGPRWLEPGGPGGRSPLEDEDEDDWTRREIREALETGAVVIPLLVGGAKRLRPDDLPGDIEALASCQYRRLSHRNADADLTGLADDLVELLPELGAAARSNGYRARSAPSADDHGTSRDGAKDARMQARVIKHRQRGGSAISTGTSPEPSSASPRARSTPEAGTCIRRVSSTWAHVFPATEAVCSTWARTMGKSGRGRTGTGGLRTKNVDRHRWHVDQRPPGTGAQRWR
ncbi:toll/interleukin-1 receptor domain-containing protein [Streptomyces stramineus]